MEVNKKITNPMFIPHWLEEGLKNISDDIKDTKPPFKAMCEDCALFRMAIVDYNLGDVKRAVVYMNVFGSTGMRAELQQSLGDELIQIMVFIKSMGFDVNETVAIGLDNYRLLKDRLIKKGVSRVKIEPKGKIPGTKIKGHKDGCRCEDCLPVLPKKAPIRSIGDEIYHPPGCHCDLCIKD